MDTSSLRKELINIVEQTMPEHQAEIEKAASWAEQMHKGQKRDDGTPYVNHVYEVALIAAMHRQSHYTIIASLLHDIVEDTKATLAQVEMRHGPEVRTIVNGVTKVEKVHFADSTERLAATHQKLMVAAVTRPESLTVKLCDRLHNVRTFDTTTKEKATRKAHETLEIYAPLAYSLSHHYIYRELEDRCFDVIEPEKMSQLRSEQDMIIKARTPIIEQMQQGIAKLLEPYDIKAVTSIRPKHVASLLRKAEDGVPIGTLHDVVSLIVIVPTTADCYLALGALHDLYRPLPGQFKDYIALPKNNGYKSLHSVVYHPIAGVPVEVQIRTPQMAHSAEWGIFEPAMGWLQDIEVADPVAFMDNVKKELFRDEIYVFDNNGSCYILPRGSTLSDFLRRTHQQELTHVESRGRKIAADDPLRNGMILQVG